MLLISYNFAYFFLVFSASIFIKDIFIKSICNIEYENKNIIRDLTKAFPLVYANFMSIMKILMIIDVSFLIFESDYRILASLFYLPIGLAFTKLFNVVSGSQSIDYKTSCNEIKNKLEITTTNPCFVLLFDENLIYRFRNLIIVQTFIFGINDMIVFLFVTIPFLLFCLDNCNLNLRKINVNFDINNLYHGELEPLFELLNRYERNVLSIYKFFFEKYLRAREYFNRNSGPNIPLGGEETYDTIPETEDKAEFDKMLREPQDDINLYPMQNPTNQEAETNGPSNENTEPLVETTKQEADTNEELHQEPEDTNSESRLSEEAFDAELKKNL